MPLLREQETSLTQFLPIILVVGLIAACSSVALAADTITGVARNQTLRLPAAGDEVILLRIDQGMEEESRTRTDPQGAFTLSVRDPTKLHMVRVVHRGVNYDQRVLVAGDISVDVFDSAAEVQGVTGNIEIIRIGTNGNLLHVSDMVEVKNDSSPLVTKSGQRTFEIYLPARAKIDSVLAAGSDKVGVMISATPIAGEPGHYAVNFPLRPGATKFAFNYDLPYEGRATFQTRNALSLHQLAVMIPPTMKFASRSPRFQILATGNDSYRVEAVNDVPAGEGPGFEISGSGPLPALPAKASKPSAVTPRAVVPSGAGFSSTQVHAAVAGSPAFRPESLPESSIRLRWFALGAGSVLLPGVFGFLLRRKLRRTAPVEARMQQPAFASSVETLKEEMFRLEVERAQGTITGDEYAQGQRGLEEALTRALDLQSQKARATPPVPSQGPKPAAFLRRA